MPKCIELLTCDWLISNFCYQAIEQVYLIKWPVSVYLSCDLPASLPFTNPLLLPQGTKKVSIGFTISLQTVGHTETFCLLFYEYIKPWICTYCCFCLLYSRLVYNFGCSKTLVHFMICVQPYFSFIHPKNSVIPWIPFFLHHRNQKFLGIWGVLFSSMKDTCCLIGLFWRCHSGSSWGVLCMAE